MKHYFILLLGFIVAMSACATGGARPQPEAIRSFDVKKYAGTWYEIGSIVQSFQKGCECTRATYVLRDDAKIDVLNECRKNGVKGEVNLAKGIARFRGDPQAGDLEVSFFLWFYGSYRIIALDRTHYEWSVVSNDKGTTLWILSREPEMDSSQIDLLLAEARRQGVDTSKFQPQNQTGCWAPKAL